MRRAGTSSAGAGTFVPEVVEPFLTFEAEFGKVAVVVGVGKATVAGMTVT